jgi:hypothetical protein
LTTQVADTTSQGDIGSDASKEPKFTYRQPKDLSEARRQLLLDNGLVHESDVAKMFDLTLMTLYKWRIGHAPPDMPKLNYVKVAREVYYRRSDLQAFITASTFKPDVLA